MTPAYTSLRGYVIAIPKIASRISAEIASFPREPQAPKGRLGSLAPPELSRADEESAPA